MRFYGFLGVLAVLLASAPALASDEYAIVATISGADGGWDFASVDPQTNRLFVARSNGVMAVDLATRKVTDILVEGAGVHGVSPIAGTPYAISANGKSANATLFDKLTGKVEATFATGQGPDALVVEPKTGLVVIFNGKSHDATLVDVATKSVVGSIALDGKPEVAAADGAGRVFVNIEDRNTIAVIEIAERRVVATYTLSGCDAPTGLAFDAQTGVLIAACDNEVAKVIDAKSGAEISSLKIGKRPDGVLVDSTRRHAFIPAADGTLAVLALRGRDDISLVGVVKTAAGAKTGAVDPCNRRRVSAERQNVGARKRRRPSQARARHIRDSSSSLRKTEITLTGRQSAEDRAMTRHASLVVALATFLTAPAMAREPAFVSPDQSNAFQILPTPPAADPTLQKRSSPNCIGSRRRARTPRSPGRSSTTRTKISFYLET